MLRALEQRLSPFKEFASTTWFAEAQALRIPQAADYLTPQYLESKRRPTPTQSREFDAKHGVFLSAPQLWADLPVLRDNCDSRRVPVAVIFLDIDDFKALNSKYGEPAVDRDLLPTLMREIESALFGHALVYRYGGDEFVAIAANSPRSVLQPLLESLRRALANASYPTIPERPTISVGVCQILPNSPITEDEALELASAAKRYAKQSGKNATAAYAQESAGGSAFEVWKD